MRTWHRVSEGQFKPPSRAVSGSDVCLWVSDADCSPCSPLVYWYPSSLLLGPPFVHPPGVIFVSCLFSPSLPLFLHISSLFPPRSSFFAPHPFPLSSFPSFPSSFTLLLLTLLFLFGFFSPLPLTPPLHMYASCSSPARPTAALSIRYGQR